MTPATTALVARVLKLREATDRAALATAQQEQHRRAAAASALARVIALEQAFVESTAAAMLASPALGLWRAAAASRLDERWRAAADAEAACAAPQAALGETIRLRLGFETLCERRTKEAERDAQRRDPLRGLMLLPGPHRGAG